MTLCPIPCFACGKTLDQSMPGVRNQPHAGLSFITHGHYGGTIFDPMDGTFIEINLCDDCLIENKDRVLHGTPRTKTTVTYGGGIQMSDEPYDVETGEIVEPPTGLARIEPYSPILSVDLLADMLEKINDAKLRVLKEGLDQDYAIIPGTGGKPSLLKPGAEKLCQLFGYRIGKMDKIDEQHEPNYGCLYKCTLQDPTGRVVGVCDGWADGGEAKARRWDRNTIVKMAQKRAFVGATLWACNASSIFTQDVEDYGRDDLRGDVRPDPAGRIPGAPPPPEVTQAVKEASHGLKRFHELVEWLVFEKKETNEDAEQLVIAAAKNCGYESTDDLAHINHFNIVKARLLADWNEQKGLLADQEEVARKKGVNEPTPGERVMLRLIGENPGISKDDLWKCINMSGVTTMDELAEEGAFEMVITYIEEMQEAAADEASGSGSPEPGPDPGDQPGE